MPDSPTRQEKVYQQHMILQQRAATQKMLQSNN